LKPIVLSGDGVDATEAPNAGWYDSELDFDCVFFPDEAGTERCFPRSLVVGPRLFSDADCARPVLAESTLGRCHAPNVRYFAAGIGCTYRAFEQGEELPASTPLFFSDNGSSCKPSTATELGRLYELKEIPTETFVGMRRTARARAPGLDAYVREGDDGSWQIVGYFDLAREAACFEASAIFGPSCAPAFGSTSELLEAGCETRLADARSRSCLIEQPTAILEGGADTSVCPATYDIELREIEGVRETTAHVVDDSSACVATGGPPMETYIQGAPLDPATLPHLETLLVGRGPLRVLFSGFGGIPYMPVVSLPLRDEAGDACFPYRFPDGSLRCVPIAFPVTHPSAFVYEDASCEGDPILPWVPSPGSCPPNPAPPRAIMLERETSECHDDSLASEVLAVVGESSESAFYARDAVSGACQPTEPIAERGVYLQLGEALKASDFAELERAIRE
jgi:hypothetical protein